MINLLAQSKNLALLFLFPALFLISCTQKDDADPQEDLYNQTETYSLTNISYGSHAHQTMDIYLPPNRNDASTKVFVLVHGGGWSSGDKNEFTETLNTLKTLFPDKAVININYRLGSSSNPGFPMQIDDIKAALAHIQLSRYDVSDQYFFIGASAGAHLSMLYAYAYDDKHEVQGVANIVGPSDLTDPAYVENFLFIPVFASLLGNVLYADNPALYAQASPAKQVTSSSPPTISFYGSIDPLIPVSQKSKLDQALQDNGIDHESTLYQNEGHGGWSGPTLTDMIAKLNLFINTYFD